jgi:ornithine cyclodeaminase/alanine dehydrogenase
MKKSEILYLSQADVERTGIEMKDIIRCVEEVFFEKGHGRVEMPPKPGVHSMPDSFIHAMPAYIPSLNSIGIKWVGGYPENFKYNLPYISGLLILNDAKTGLPVAVMDCVWITAMRTGAATAISAKYLAKKDSHSVGILGAGVQGFTNLEALKVLFPINTVRVYDILPAKQIEYQQKVKKRWPEIDVIKVDEPEKAVKGLDIVVTAGPIVKKPHATIKSGWLSRGSFASLVDFDSYWDTPALQEVDKFTTDDVAQLNHYREMGFFQGIPSIYSDLGELVIGKKKGRIQNDERTIACNLGLAINDMATASLIYKKACNINIGTRLPL